MALYLPRQHIVIDIVDDPCNMPADRDAFPDARVISMSTEQLADPALVRFLAISARGRKGAEAPENPPAPRRSTMRRASGS